MNQFSKTFTTVAVILCFAATVLHAQKKQEVRKSQRGEVSQFVADTRITIDYNRPVARGRELFGKLVPWGEVWHPGADEASYITLSNDVKVNGQPLPMGTYTLWIIPNPDEFTILFKKDFPRWHMPHPAADDDFALRVRVKPHSGTHMETMAFYFPLVEDRHAELAFHWGTVVVPLEIDVP